MKLTRPWVATAIWRPPCLVAFPHIVQEVPVRVRIAVAQTGREIEVEVDDAEAFIAEVQAAFEADARLFWVTDVKKNRVALAVSKIGYIEVETDDTKQQVGFG